MSPKNISIYMYVSIQDKEELTCAMIDGLHDDYINIISNHMGGEQ